jgi:hypothetical protein
MVQFCLETAVHIYTWKSYLNVFFGIIVLLRVPVALILPYKTRSE